jgi:hypothetical protein
VGEESDDEDDASIGATFGPPDEGAEGAASAADSRLTYANDVFRHFAFRMSTFGDAYPFELTAEGALQVRPIDTDRQRLYLFLLLCSSLRYVRRSEWDFLTKGFERLSANAIRTWLPPGSEVHVFGTSAEAGARYTGTLREKLKLLADDLSEQLLLRDDQFRPGDTGDTGLDVVAWVPFGDMSNARLVVLAQATCRVEWKTKQMESSRMQWAGILTWKAPHNSVLCIPFCFRTPDGGWFFERDIVETILMDRVRLLALLQSGGGSLPEPQLKVVESALAYKEPIV